MKITSKTTRIITLELNESEARLLQIYLRFSYLNNIHKQSNEVNILSEEITKELKAVLDSEP